MRTTGIVGWMLCLIIQMAGVPSLHAAEKKPDVDPVSKPAVQESMVSEADQQLIQTVSLERVNLDKMRRDILLEQGRLKQTRKEIEVRIHDLKQLKTEVNARISTLQNIEEKEIKHLVKVYESMSPEEAAPLIEGLKQEISVELLSRMKGKKAGKILEFVEKKKAVELSEVLAERKELKGK